MENKQLPVKVKVSENVLFQQTANEGVLLDMNSEQYFGLDDVAARIWEIMAGEENVNIVLEKLLAEFNVKSEVLTQDLIILLLQLENDKLLTLEY